MRILIALLLLASVAEAEKFILANQSTSAKRQVTFYCYDSTGLAPDTGINVVGGAQPDVSLDDASYTHAGSPAEIGTMLAVTAANGVYYAVLSQEITNNVGKKLTAFYRNGTNPPCISEPMRFVAFDIDLAIAQTGDSYSIVNNGTYGNAYLLRAQSPANGVKTDASGNIHAVDSSGNAVAPATATTNIYNIVNNGTYGLPNILNTWFTTAVPGGFGAGTAGKLLGTPLRLSN